VSTLARKLPSWHGERLMTRARVVDADADCVRESVIQSNGGFSLYGAVERLRR
jgi:hypothetical protein